MIAKTLREIANEAVWRIGRQIGFGKTVFNLSPDNNRLPSEIAEDIRREIERLLEEAKGE